MTRTKLGLMGLCAVVVGVMAMSAGTAQGALSWLVLNSSGTTATELTATLQGEKDSFELTLLSNISGLMISVSCLQFSIPNGLLTISGQIEPGGKAQFSGCEVRASGALLPCTVSGGGGASGTILTKFKGKLVLNASSEVLTEIAPETGTTLVKLLFKGEECSLPEEDPLNGVLFLKDCTGKSLTHAVKHLVEEGPGTKLTLGTASATLLGSAWVKLGGTHVGLAWSAMDA